ncbi:MAG: aldo/keto reductase, partial [Acidobacteriaceae bacterium]
VVRPAVTRLPAVRKRVAQAAAGMRSKAKFSAGEARLSLERSLRELGVDAIDVWLLHEVTAEDLNGSDLLPFLQNAQQRGLIGVYGVGTERARLRQLWERHRSYCAVLQFEWSVLEEEDASFTGAFVIHHRAISGALGLLHRFLQQDFDLCRRWSNAVDMDLSDAKLLAGILLQAALAANPKGMVLFSSRAPEHIRANVQAAGNLDAGARGRRLLELVAEKRNEIRMLEKS